MGSPYSSISALLRVAKRGTHKDLTATQRLIFACWMSTKPRRPGPTTGSVSILPSEVAWTIPFVIQLCGEYVIEIGFDILNFVKAFLLRRPAMLSEYAWFGRGNPEFMSITRQRTISYWLDDYQYQLRQEQYPQFYAHRGPYRVSGRAGLGRPLKRTPLCVSTAPPARTSTNHVR